MNQKFGNIPEIQLNHFKQFLSKDSGAPTEFRAEGGGGQSGSRRGSEQVGGGGSLTHRVMFSRGGGADALACTPLQTPMSKVDLYSQAN